MDSVDFDRTEVADARRRREAARERVEALLEEQRRREDRDRRRRRVAVRRPSRGDRHASTAAAWSRLDA
jgi:hypothetical protein